MYSNLMTTFGIAFVLFILFMVMGYMSRSGFSGIFKILLSRLLILSFAVAILLAVGIGISSVVIGTGPLETFDLLFNLVKEKLGSL